MTISFEAVPYEGRPIETSRPDRLAVEAWMQGVPAVHPTRARVLELGCAEGANLIPHAYHCPDATFVGIDQSPRQIEAAIARCDALGLDNCTFMVGDIAALPEEAAGPWDYILCHGVLSWVPEPVREAIFDVLRDRLAPHGVGYVSYNVQPGWAMRGMVRQLLMARTRHLEAPADKLEEARALLSFVADTPFTDHHYSAYMADEARALLEHRDAYIAHEYLAGDNVAFRYGEIVQHAESRGLSVLAELSPIAHRGVEDRMRNAVTAITADPVEREELIDALHGRAFRASLFVREGIERLAPEPSLRALLDSGSFVTRLSPVSARPSLLDGDAEEFADPDDVRVSMTHPLLKAALLVLARAFPVAVSADELVQRATGLLIERRVWTAEQTAHDDDRAALMADLVRLVRLRHAELRPSSPAIVGRAGDRPRVTTLARHEVRREGWFTNVFHDPVHLDDAARYLVDLMDGSRHRDELTAQLAATLDKHEVAIRDDKGETLEGESKQRAIRVFVDRNILILESQGVMER